MHHAGTTLHQHQLVQAAMAVGYQFPVVQRGTGSDGFAVHHVGELGGLAEETVGQNDAVVELHVRIVQVLDGMRY